MIIIDCQIIHGYPTVGDGKHHEKDSFFARVLTLESVAIISRHMLAMNDALGTRTTTRNKTATATTSMSIDDDDENKNQK